MTGELEKLRRKSLFDMAQANTSLSGDILKWTLASLLVVNGGAVVALIGSNDLRGSAFKEAAYFFGGGMLAALVAGVAWVFALGLLSADGLKRAWDSAPIEMNDLSNLKMEKATRSWTGAACILLIVSFAAFALGCISTAFLPERAELDRLSAESGEAAAKSIAESQALLDLLKNPRVTAEQKEAAQERQRAAYIDARIKSARVMRALGEKADLIDFVTGAGKASSNSGASK